MRDGKNEAELAELVGALPRLVALMHEGVARKRPNASFTRELGIETVFDGSFDYHSCVAAHWALLVHARTAPDGGLAAELLGRLTPAALERELATLDSEAPKGGRRVTWPYDVAWFVMLLAELASHDGVDEAALRTLRLAAERRLFEALEEVPFPEEVPVAQAGGKRHCGFYRSWLLAYWFLAQSEPLTEGAQAVLARHRAERIEPERAAIETLDESHPYDFLWVPAVLALIDRTGPGTDSRTGTYVLHEGDAKLPDSVTIGTVHPLGVHLSRLWPLALDAHAGDARARAAFERGMRALLARPDLWGEDFAACSHWVPQYVFVGMWLARGRP